MTGVTNDVGTRAAASEPHAEGAAQLSKAKRNKAKAKAKSKAPTTRAAASVKATAKAKSKAPTTRAAASDRRSTTAQKLRSLQLFLKSRPCGTSVADRRAMWKSMSSEDKSKYTEDTRAERGF